MGNKVTLIYEIIEQYKEAYFGLNELDYLWNSLRNEDLSLTLKYKDAPNSTMTVNVYRENLIRDILIGSRENTYNIYKRRYKEQGEKAIHDIQGLLKLTYEEAIEFLMRQIDE